MALKYVNFVEASREESFLVKERRTLPVSQTPYSSKNLMTLSCSTDVYDITLFVTKPAVVKSLKSGINARHTGVRQEYLAGAWRNGRGGIRILGDITDFEADCAMFGR